MRFALPIILTMALCARAPFCWSDEQQDSEAGKPTTTLVTQSGDRLVGHWLASDQSKTISWQVEGLVEPLHFASENLSTIQVRHVGKVPKIEGSYRCELVGGDVLYGTPVSIDEKELVFELPHSGPLRINRNRLRKLAPLHVFDQEFSTTPSSLTEWRTSPFSWQEAAGHVTAVKDGAELRSTLRLGSKSQTTIRIAWDNLPDFRIDFGATADYDSGLRLETWQDQLVLVAESPQDADILLVRDLTDRADELLLHVYVDTEQQTIFVADQSGKSLGKLARKGVYETSFQVQARKKGLHFYSATVTPWDGSSFELESPTESTIRFNDGTTKIANVTSWNPQTQEWTAVIESEKDSESTENQISSRKIKSLLFATDPLPGDETEADPNVIQVVSRTGIKLTGTIASLRDQAIELSCQGIKDPVLISLSRLQGLVFLNNVETQPAKPDKYPRLQVDGSTIVGKLVEGKASETADNLATALVWKPNSSKNAAAISRHASGSITYREHMPQVKSRKQDNQVKQEKGTFVDNIVSLLSHTERKIRWDQKVNTLSAGNTLHLRSGDSIPCKPTRIDREGVTFTSSVTEATFVSHERIKVLVLKGGFKPAQVTEAERDRLLTLPRIQQEYPPTHLLLSTDGDLLRTRVSAMDEKSIIAEIRLNPVELPRERIAAIAWLHKDELQDGQEENVEKAAEANFRVQAVQSDGVRLTFQPQEFTEGVLLGESDVFKKCRVEVTQVDKFLFGSAIVEDLKHQSHQLLALKPAIEPRFVTAESDEPTDLGQGSALVGKAAPPIRLKDLDDNKFDLKDHRGKVVVLDFWATWCGPCVQWMPQLEEITADFPDKVEMITINLMQDKDTILPALERMQISPTVLLDRDGVVADAYQASAIPQTVIIDQDGNIARLFIGGSPQIKQPLIDALEELTSEPAAN